MPRLRPPGGRQAAAITKEPSNEALHEGFENEPLVGEEVGDGEGLQGIGEAPSEEVSPSVLQAQIDALRRSNKEYEDRLRAEQERAEAAQRGLQERDFEVTRLQEQSTNSNLEAINAALAAAQAEAETAQRDIENTASVGDFKGQAEAYRKLSRAEARMMNLENGKDALERELKERPKPEVRQQQQQADPLENFNIPALAKTWLREHPEFLSDPRKNSKLQHLHWEVVDEGYAPYSKDYFEVMEGRLGMRQMPVIKKPQQTEDDMEDQPEPTRKGIVSAPVSREAPSGDGTRTGSRVTLTPRQKEAAKIAGVSEAEYAKQLLRLHKEKSEGNYTGGQ